MSAKNAKCACIAIIQLVLPVREIAELVSSYIPHMTDADVIRGRLAHGMREWVVKANDEFVPEKDRDRETTMNITRQEVIFKICMSDPKWSGSEQYIEFNLEETCNRYHSHGTHGILRDTDTYDPKEVLMKQWERESALKYSSPLFARMIERVRTVMNERILVILAKANRHAYC